VDENTVAGLEAGADEFKCGIDDFPGDIRRIGSINKDE